MDTTLRRRHVLRSPVAFFRIYGCACAIVTGLALAFAPAAHAASTATTDATAMGASIATTPSTLTSASFVTRPTLGNPTAIATSFGMNFIPQHGLDMAVLGTGDATNTTGPEGTDLSAGDDGGTDGFGGTYRNAHDVTTLRLHLNIPARQTCALFDFMFLTDDVGLAASPFDAYHTKYVDGFIAEYDPTVAWSQSDVYSLPYDQGPTGNLAVTSGGYMYDANYLGAGPGRSAFALHGGGTAYNASSGWVVASTPVTSGSHNLDFTIFDRTDALYESAALIDNLRFAARLPGTCQTGTTGVNGDIDAPAVTMATPPGAATGRSYQATTFTGTLGQGGGDVQAATVEVHAGTSANGALVRTLPATVSGGGFTARISTALPNGTYTALALQDDGANIGFSAPATFTIVSRPTSTRRPSAAGTARVGRRLSCRHGAWTGSTAFTYSYRWQRISGGRRQTVSSRTKYRLRRADLGHTLRCVVTARNGAGATRAYSRPTGAVRL